MVNQQHLDILKQGVEVWNKWREEHPEIQPDLRESDLFGANLEGADLHEALLGGADLREAHLEGANLQRAHLAGEISSAYHKFYRQMRYYHIPDNNDTEDIEDEWSHLLAADLRHAFFNNATNLTDVILSENINGSNLYYAVFLADVCWNGVNLAVVDWTQLNRLGDEYLAGIQRDRNARVNTLRAAVRANRQLATMLQSQGLNEVASHYAYRARVIERQVLRGEVRFFNIVRSVLQGDKDMFWNWERIVQGNVHVYLGEPARYRRQANLLTILWEVVLSFILMVPLSIGSLSLAVVHGIWQITPWQNRKKQVLNFLDRASSLIAPLLVLAMLLLPTLIAFLVFLDIQSTWKETVPVPIRIPLSVVSTIVMLYLFVFVGLFWQSVQVNRAIRHVGENLYIPKVSLLLLDRLYWHVLVVNEALIGYSKYIFSLFLDLFTGYGYRLGRSFRTYLIVIGIFAVIYHLLNPQFAWNEVLVMSMTGFHGRGFFPGTFRPYDPTVFASAIEAFIGLIIEVIFIATLTQRFFEK